MGWACWNRWGKLTALAAVGAIAIAGCMPHGPEGELFPTGGHRVNPAGANQLFEHQSFEGVDLLAALDPENKREHWLPREEPRPAPADAGGTKESGSAGRPAPITSEKEAARELQLAFQAFYSYGDLERRRNRIQDTVIAASEQRCNAYKTYLRGLESHTSFGLGSLATIFGTAGTIVTDQFVTRVLSGLSGISSGLNAHFNKAFLSSLTVTVITQGLDARRDEMRAAIVQKRTDIDSYTMEAAIADAVRFHGACSVIAGLEEASQRIRDVEVGATKKDGEIVTLVQPKRVGGSVVEAPVRLRNVDLSSTATAQENIHAVKRAFGGAIGRFKDTLAARQIDINAGSDGGIGMAIDDVFGKGQDLFQRLHECDRDLNLTQRVEAAQTRFDASETAERERTALQLQEERLYAARTMLLDLDQIHNEFEAMFRELEQQVRSVREPNQLSRIVSHIKGYRLPSFVCPAKT